MRFLAGREIAETCDKKGPRISQSDRAQSQLEPDPFRLVLRGLLSFSLTRSLASSLSSLLMMMMQNKAATIQSVGNLRPVLFRQPPLLALRSLVDLAAPQRAATHQLQVEQLFNLDGFARQSLVAARGGPLVTEQNVGPNVRTNGAPLRPFRHSQLGLVSRQSSPTEKERGRPFRFQSTNSEQIGHSQSQRAANKTSRHPKDKLCPSRQLASCVCLESVPLWKWTFSLCSALLCWLTTGRLSVQWPGKQTSRRRTNKWAHKYMHMETDICMLGHREKQARGRRDCLLGMFRRTQLDMSWLGTSSPRHWLCSLSILT